MSDPLQALLQGPAKPSLFPPNSRYAGIDTSTVKTAPALTSCDATPAPPFCAAAGTFRITPGIHRSPRRPAR